MVFTLSLYGISTTAGGNVQLAVNFVSPTTGLVAGTIVHTGDGDDYGTYSGIVFLNANTDVVSVVNKSGATLTLTSPGGANSTYITFTLIN